VVEWVGNGQYYFDDPVGPKAVSFVLTPGSTLVDTFAAEMARFSAASIETSIGIVRSPMPKSTAWLMIQAYYAAFYAAHSILRSVGISASNFKTAQCQKADAIADALGFSQAPLDAAQFRCTYSVPSGRLNCVKAPGSGVHEQFWRVFDGFLSDALNHILASTFVSSKDAQDIYIKLRALQEVLRRHNHSKGNWLSTVRNDVTYTQQHSAWFPYGRSRTECDRLFALNESWQSEADAIILDPHASSDVEIFIIACAFLVSLSVSITKDMAQRCSSGESFLRSGPIRLLSQTLRR
jgi:hypothetical protein